MNTSVKQKKELWPRFIKACESQWMGGGDRYALSDDKEFTDLICEAVGNGWIGGNIIKYVGEVNNTTPKPEVDFLKIAVWAFIWWIKEQGNMTQRDEGEEFSANELNIAAPAIKHKKDCNISHGGVTCTCGAIEETE